MRRLYVCVRASARVYATEVRANKTVNFPCAIVKCVCACCVRLFCVRRARPGLTNKTRRMCAHNCVHVALLLFGVHIITSLLQIVADDFAETLIFRRSSGGGMCGMCFQVIYMACHSPVNHSMAPAPEERKCDWIAIALHVEFGVRGACIPAHPWIYVIAVFVLNARSRASEHMCILPIFITQVSRVGTPSACLQWGLMADTCETHAMATIAHNDLCPSHNVQLSIRCLHVCARVPAPGCGNWITHRD